MRSYIKIYGPPVVEAIRALEKLAVEMPEVCIMDTIMVQGLPPRLARDIGASPVREAGDAERGQYFGDWAVGYFRSSGIPVSLERCMSIVSESGESLGDHNFFFEWREEPSRDQVHDLMERVDDALEPLGCYYTIELR